MTTITVMYFAKLRDEAGVAEQAVAVAAGETAADVYARVAAEHRFSLHERDLRVAVNDKFADWGTSLTAGDRVAFLPPMSGG